MHIYVALIYYVDLVYTSVYYFWFAALVNKRFLILFIL